MISKRLSRTFVDKQRGVLVPTATFPIKVNDIERDVLEDTIRAGGHRWRYRKSLHTTLHTGVADRQLQMSDFVIVITASGLMSSIFEVIVILISLLSRSLLISKPSKFS
jgi:hypothetical protein